MIDIRPQRCRILHVPDCVHTSDVKTSSGYRNQYDRLRDVVDLLLSITPDVAAFEMQRLS